MISAETHVISRGCPPFMTLQSGTHVVKAFDGLVGLWILEEAVVSGLVLLHGGLEEQSSAADQLSQQPAIVLVDLLRACAHSAQIASTGWRCGVHSERIHLERC